ncbi:hypothetical protein LEP1GSC052_1782 [Leptospira kmetyi serovar Malaysia str. Bejo-Iso9]|nr:hypothetical protein LEP1GSC052_1782 [Leptospira kmetyi serovar Malaysia str. Bejo-Iso9]
MTRLISIKPPKKVLTLVYSSNSSLVNSKTKTVFAKGFFPSRTL